MATITKVKNKKGVRWRAQVYVLGVRDSDRFDTKPQAAQWAHEREIELRKGKDLIAGKTLADAFDRYGQELPNSRKGLQWDLVRLDKFKRDPIANVSAVLLTVEHADEFIERAQAAGLENNTIIREFGLLKPVVRKMVKWKWISDYPWEGLTMPKAGKRRSRLYTTVEIEGIKRSAGLSVGRPITTVTQQVGLAFVIATESGMRLNEICSMQDAWWSRNGRFVSLPDWVTKTGEARDVPLSSIAIECLTQLSVGPTGELFGVNAQVASTLFGRIRRRAGINDATFHDSRHYAVTKLSKKFDVLSLARVIGHSDIRELMTYYEADAAELATMLD